MLSVILLCIVFDGVGYYQEEKVLRFEELIFFTNSEFSVANNTKIQTLRCCKAFVMAEEQSLYG